ncbi:MAG: Spi family protease inhibitor [Candidatus Cloacimonetes bacterium]|nr:Spi family protease inhibitor [Candidatus Cloacimonadota bacterium]
MKKLLLSICFTLWLVILCANQIESRLALDIAKGLFTQMGGAEADASTLQEYSSEPGSADIYIIRFSPKGFVILAADDRSVPVWHIRWIVIFRCKTFRLQ